MEIVQMYNICTLWLFNIAMENPLQMEVLMGKSSINEPFSIAMLNSQRVYVFVDGCRHVL
jgi:hypothetical protein